MAWFNRLSNLVRRRDLNAEIDEELQFHIETRIRDNIASEGFDWFWLDETEPDLVPDGNFFSIGSGDRYHNIFPLLHTTGVAEGSARDRPKMRNLILSRAAYLGVQRNGALLRTSVMATHEREHLDRALEIFGRVKGEVEAMTPPAVD